MEKDKRTFAFLFLSCILFFLSRKRYKDVELLEFLSTCIRMHSCDIELEFISKLLLVADHNLPIGPPIR